MTVREIRALTGPVLKETGVEGEGASMGEEEREKADGATENTGR